MHGIIVKILALPDCDISADTYQFLDDIYSALEDKTGKTFTAAVTAAVKDQEMALPNQSRAEEAYLKLQEIKQLLDGWKKQVILAHTALQTVAPKEQETVDEIDNDVFIELAIKAMPAHNKKTLLLKHKLLHWCAIIERGILSFYFTTILSATKISIWSHYINRLKHHCTLFKEALQQCILLKVISIDKDIHDFYFKNAVDLGFDHHANNVARDLDHDHEYVAPIKPVRPLIDKFMQINDLSNTLNRVNNQMDLVRILIEFIQKLEVLGIQMTPATPYRLTLFGQLSVTLPAVDMSALGYLSINRLQRETTSLNRLEKLFIQKCHKICEKLQRDEDVSQQRAASVTL